MFAVVFEAKNYKDPLFWYETCISSLWDINLYVKIKDSIFCEKDPNVYNIQVKKATIKTTCLFSKQMYVSIRKLVLNYESDGFYFIVET